MNYKIGKNTRKDISCHTVSLSTHPVKYFLSTEKMCDVFANFISAMSRLPAIYLCHWVNQTLIPPNLMSENQTLITKKTSKFTINNFLWFLFFKIKWLFQGRQKGIKCFFETVSFNNFLTIYFEYLSWEAQ